MRAIIFCLLLSLIAPFAHADRVDSLVGKTIVIPDFYPYHGHHDDYTVKEHFLPIIYSPQVLVKGKLEKKFLLDNQNIYGLPITINEIILSNEGKKDEVLFLKASTNTNDFVIAVPLRYAENKAPLSSLWLDKTTKESGTFTNHYTSHKKFVDIPYFEYNPLDSIDVNFRDKILYPIKSGYGGYGINEDKSKYHPSHWSLYVGMPYKFRGFEFLQHHSPNHVSLNAVFLDKDGNDVYMPIRPESGSYQNCGACRLADFSNYFITEDSLINLLNQPVYVDCLAPLDLLVSKEIFVETNKCGGYKLIDPKAEDFRLYHSSDYKVEGYFKLLDILITPMNEGYPWFGWSAYLESQRNGDRYFYPLTSETVKFIKDGAIKHEEQRLAQEAQERRWQERERQEQAEEQAYINNLAKKYGRANAKLIADGKVRIGFTKAMCAEAWGEPSDVTTVATQYGTAEAWWYGYCSVLYFQGNKLVIIQN